MTSPGGQGRARAPNSGGYPFLASKGRVLPLGRGQECLERGGAGERRVVCLVSACTFKLPYATVSSFYDFDFACWICVCLFVCLFCFSFFSRVCSFLFTQLDCSQGSSCLSCMTLHCRLCLLHCRVVSLCRRFVTK